MLFYVFLEADTDFYGVMFYLLPFDFDNDFYWALPLFIMIGSTLVLK